MVPLLMHLHASLSGNVIWQWISQHPTSDQAVSGLIPASSRAGCTFIPPRHEWALETHGAIVGPNYYWNNKSFLNLFCCTLLGVQSPRCLKLGSYSVRKFIQLILCLRKQCRKMHLLYLTSISLPLAAAFAYVVFFLSVAACAQAIRALTLLSGCLAKSKKCDWDFHRLDSCWKTKNVQLGFWESASLEKSIQQPFIFIIFPLFESAHTCHLSCRESIVLHTKFIQERSISQENWLACSLLFSQWHVVSFLRVHTTPLSMRTLNPPPKRLL